MASTILEQVLENLERGATIPLNQAHRHEVDSAPFAESAISPAMIRAVEARILAELDAELDRFLSRIDFDASSATATAQVRQDISRHLTAVADEQLQQLAQAAPAATPTGDPVAPWDPATSANEAIARDLDDSANLGNEGVLLRDSVPAVSPFDDYYQESVGELEPVLISASSAPAALEPPDSPEPSRSAAAAADAADETPQELTQVMSLQRPEEPSSGTTDSAAPLANSGRASADPGPPSRQVPITDIQAMIDQLI